MLLPRPIITTSWTVAGKRQLMLSRWGTYASAPLLSVPLSRSLPWATGRRPAIASNRVLLPAPFGPRIPISVPGPMSKVIPVSATCPPRSTVMSSTLMLGSEVILTVSDPQVIRSYGLPAPDATRFPPMVTVTVRVADVAGHFRASTIRPTFVRIISM